MPVRATLTFRVKEGAGDSFEQAWRRIAARVREHPDSLRQTLARDPDDPRTFVMTTDWANRESFSEFESSREQEELTAPLRELRESSAMNVHDIVVHIEGQTQ
ncbi:MAG TPA: antibiotic biosynthesis monooxygenase family protein [Solirubrobacteraceae bacterium]|jgi:heme-degrading monooxygenase HmoA|nr:antibiotic biosynthesis monooxygenase family protein [Solirubrobacteraceae bacterium]